MESKRTLFLEKKAHNTPTPLKSQHFWHLKSFLKFSMFLKKGKNGSEYSPEHNKYFTATVFDGFTLENKTT